MICCFAGLGKYHTIMDNLVMLFKSMGTYAFFYTPLLKLKIMNLFNIVLLSFIHSYF